MTKVPSTRTLLQLFSVPSEKKIISPIPESPSGEARDAKLKRSSEKKHYEPAPALPPLLSLELAAAELELSCIARSTLGATESTPST